MVDKLRLNRDQIARIVGNDPEAIRQFEKLFAASNFSASELETVSIAAGIADSKAGQALAELKRIADAVEALAYAPVIQANNSVVTDYIDLPDDGPHVTQQRRIQWNKDDGTVDVGLYGGSVLQVGQELHYYAKNTSGATIADGSPVIVTGTLGASGKLTIGPAIGDGSVQQRYFIGAATQDIANNDFGYVTGFGLVRGFDTSAYADGDLLYVSETTAGDWTNVMPVAPNWRQAQAIVVHAANNGSIFIRVTPEHKLGELQDVDAPSPVDGQTLVWNTDKWELASPAGGYTVTTQAVSYSETATSGEFVRLITGAAVTVSLPTAVGNTAKLTYKLTVAGTMTLDAAGAETIDGGATASTSIQYTAITIVSDGANWQVI